MYKKAPNEIDVKMFERKFKFDWTVAEIRASLLNSFSTILAKGGTRTDCAVEFLNSMNLPVSQNMICRCLTAYTRIKNTPPDQKFNLSRVRIYRKWTDHERDYVVSTIDSGKCLKKESVAKLATEFNTSPGSIFRVYRDRRAKKFGPRYRSLKDIASSISNWLYKINELNPIVAEDLNKATVRILKTTYLLLLEPAPNPMPSQAQITEDRYNKALLAIEKLKQENAKLAKKLKLSPIVVTTTASTKTKPITLNEVNFVVPVDKKTTATKK